MHVVKTDSQLLSDDVDFARGATRSSPAREGPKSKRTEVCFTQSRQKCEGGAKILEFVSIKGCST